MEIQQFEKANGSEALKFVFEISTQHRDIFLGNLLQMKISFET